MKKTTPVKIIISKQQSKKIKLLISNKGLMRSSAKQLFSLLALQFREHVQRNYNRNKLSKCKKRSLLLLTVYLFKLH